MITRISTFLHSSKRPYPTQLTSPHPRSTTTTPLLLIPGHQDYLSSYPTPLLLRRHRCCNYKSLWLCGTIAGFKVVSLQCVLYMLSGRGSYDSSIFVFLWKLEATWVVLNQHVWCLLQRYNRKQSWWCSSVATASTSTTCKSCCELRNCCGHSLLVVLLHDLEVNRGALTPRCFIFAPQYFIG